MIPITTNATSALDISLSTLIETSPLLGGKLENRAPVRDRQDIDLIRNIMTRTGRLIADTKQAQRFHFGAMDFLVERHDGKPVFVPIEMNGTGMAGVSNNPLFVMQTLLEEMTQATQRLPTSEQPLFLAPFSGTQVMATSGTSQLLHERILFAQALKAGYQTSYGQANILALPTLLETGTYKNHLPTVVLGFLKDFIPHLKIQDGRLTLFGRVVHGSIHDQFCDIVYHSFKNDWAVGLPYFINHVFPITTDKNATLALYNRFLASHATPHIHRTVFTESCQDRQQLIDSVLAARTMGKAVVIKPHASGLGRGIDFFVRPESDQAVIAKIDASIESCQRYYGVDDYVFPYAVCEFIDSPVIDSPSYALHGHKFELRFFMFRENQSVYAIPSIVKISSMRYDPDAIDRLMLMNNVAITKKITTKTGVDFILPLANEQTLQILGLDTSHLFECCQFLTDYFDDALSTLDVLHPCPANCSTSSPAT